jgi:hypothetical protein
VVYTFRSESSYIEYIPICHTIWMHLKREPALFIGCYLFRWIITHLHISWGLRHQDAHIDERQADSVPRTSTYGFTRKSNARKKNYSHPLISWSWQWRRAPIIYTPKVTAMIGREHRMDLVALRLGYADCVWQGLWADVNSCRSSAESKHARRAPWELFLASSDIFSEWIGCCGTCMSW